jgi:uncharacterized membrane protein
MLKKHLIWVLIILFSVIYGTYSVVRHLKFETYIFDLGYYDQLLWLVSHGKPFFSSVIEAHPWTDHFSPSLFLLVPLYWIWDSPVVLLVFQAVFVSLGAYPIYLLSMKKTKSFLFSSAIAICYLLFYGLQNAIAYDFHTVALGPTLLAFIFWFYDEKKYKVFWLLLIIFVGLQENFFILSSALGLFISLKYKDHKRGIPIVVGGIVLAVLLLFFLIPNVFGGKYYYIPRHLQNLDISSTVRLLYTPGSKIDVVFFSVASFGLLPLLSPVSFVLLGEEFLGRFLGTTNSNWWILGFHYNAILAPILAFAAIDTVEKYFSKRINIAILLLIAGTAISLIRVKPNIYQIFSKNYYDFSKIKDAEEVIKYLPKSSRVAASNNLGAQIAHREVLIFLTNCMENSNMWGPDGKRCYKTKPDYIFADLDPNGFNNYYPDYDRDSIIRYLDYVQKNGEFSLVNNKGYVYLLKRN